MWIELYDNPLFAAEGGEKILGFLKGFSRKFDDFELIITCPPLFKLRINRGGQVIRNRTDRLLGEGGVFLLPKV